MSEDRDRLAKRSADLLHELGTLYVRPELETGDATERHDAFRRSEALVFTLSELLKGAYDAREVDDFARFSDSVASIDPRRGRPWEPAERLQELEWQLQTFPPEHAEERSAAEREASVLRERVELADRLGQLTRVALFGVHAWILRDYDRGRIDSADYARWAERLPPLAPLDELWQTFLAATSIESAERFNWLRWDLEEHRGRGAFVGSAPEHWMELLGAVRALQLIAEAEAADRPIEIPPSPEIVYLGRPQDALGSRLDQFQADPDKWLPIIGEAGLQAIPTFREALQRAVAIQEEREAEELRGAPLSEALIDEMWVNFVTQWRQSGQMREIIRRYGRYGTGEGAPDDVGYFGINVLDSKAAYVEEARIRFSQHGAEYGRELGHAEDNRVLFEILELVPKGPEAVSEDQLTSHLDGALAVLKSRSPDVIILVLNSWRAPTTLQASGKFRWTEELDERGVRAGLYDGHPTLILRFAGPPAILVTNLKALGRWLQYDPGEVHADIVRIEDGVTLQIDEITEEKAHQLVAEHESFRRDERGQPRTEAQAVADLRKQVHLRILERFRFLIDDPEAATQIGLLEEP